MSKETLAWLNQNTLSGYTDKRGQAWHYRASDQGTESNHYSGAIPVEDVRRRLFNWEPVRADVTATALTDDGVMTITDPTRVAIVRPDTQTVLGVFRDGYKIHGYNEWLINTVSTILDADLAIGSAGLLKGGAVAWVMVEMEDTISTPEGVTYRPFLTAATSLDGSVATTYVAGNQVTSCDNTLQVALRERDALKIKIRHSKNSLNRIGDVREALGVLHTEADDFAATVKALCETTVTDAQWNAFLDAHLGERPRADVKGSVAKWEHQRGEYNQMYKHDDRASQWQGTAYGVLSADNTIRHHVKATRGDTIRFERNAMSMINGVTRKADNDALMTLERVLTTV